MLLRINPKLWQDLNAWAQDELHSLNGQIEYVLREAVRKRKKRNNSNSDT
ncbi:MAG: Arc family DNA binding domain-containing protein [Candidatus Latescibacteria bacterium]|nr:Arc family DNA binding domain-containing protein [Candidatus Latescibacterota bacterium]